MDPEKPKQYNIPIHLRPFVATKLKRLEDAGIVRKAKKSRFVSLLYVVVKDLLAHKIRLVLDIRTVDKAIMRDPFQMPLIQEILAKASEDQNSIISRS